jgi:hypothetical protein
MNQCALSVWEVSLSAVYAMPLIPDARGTVLRNEPPQCID